MEGRGGATRAPPPRRRQIRGSRRASTRTGGERRTRRNREGSSQGGTTGGCERISRHATSRDERDTMHGRMSGDFRSPAPSSYLLRLELAGPVIQEGL